MKGKNLFAAHRQLLLVSLFVMQGCTYLAPSISMIKQTAVPPCPESQTCRFPNLAGAATDINNALTDMEGKRNSSLRENRGLGVATFGLGFGALGYGLHSGHSTAVKNLGLAAGGAYGANSLFAPTSQAQVYQNGLVGLSCIQSRAQSFWFEMEINEADLIKQKDKLKSNSFQCVESEIVENVRFKYLELTTAFEEAHKYDIGYATTAISIANRMIHTVNSQLIDQTPNPEAIKSALASLPTFGALGAKPVANSVAPVDADGEPAPAALVIVMDPAVCARIEPGERERLGTYLSKALKIKTNIENAVLAFNQIGANCILAEAPIVPLQVSKSDVVVTKDMQNFDVTITGGKGNYYLVQSKQLTGINVRLIKDTLVINRHGNLVNGEKSEIEIRDGTNVTKPIIVTITASTN